MRRRALLSAAIGAAAAPLAAGCLATSDAKYDLMVRDWQELEHRSFPLHPDTGDSIRVEFQPTQTHGAEIEVYKPSILESSSPLFEAGPYRSSGPLDGGDADTDFPTVEYEVEESGKHSVVVHPCCRPGSGIARAWVRIYLDRA
ncbi:MAG: hypothetical protein ACLFMX_02520 [Halobacteriales archaeon]